MKTGSWLRWCVLVSSVFTFCACGSNPSTASPAASPTSQQQAAAATDTVVPVSPTETAGATAIAALTQEDMLNIVRFSLGAFPWRLEQSVLATSSGHTQTSLTELQSSTRGYNQSVQMVGTETVTIESIVIDSQFYVKMTGGLAETYGLVDGQWTEVPPDSPLRQLADTSAVDPSKLAAIFATDFASIAGQNGLDALVFEAVGAEELDGVLTNIYEAKGETFTYRWWIGADGRFYKTTVELPEATRTIVMHYDPSLTVQPPLP